MSSGNPQSGGRSLSEPSVEREFRSSQRRLEGKLGVWAIVFLVLAAAAPLGVMGGTIPIGISIGNGLGFPATFLFGAIVLLLFAVGYTSLTKYVKNAGAFYAYIAKGLGNRVGTGAAFLAGVAYMAETIAVYGLLAAGCVNLFGSWGISVPWEVFALGGIMIVGFLGYRHINLTAILCAAFMICEILIIVALDIAVLLNGGGPEGLSTGFLQPLNIISGAPGLALLFCLLSFLGVEATAVYRNESRDPDRTVPRATYLAISLIGIFYIVSTWLLISAWGDTKAVSTAVDNPVSMLPLAINAYLGWGALQVYEVLFVVSLFICVLAFHNIVSRYLFTLSNRSALPVFLGNAHRIHGSPHLPSLVATAISAIAIIGSSLIGLDPVDQVYTWLAGACTVAFVILLAGTTASVFVFYNGQRRRGELRESKLKVIYVPIFAFILLVAIFILVMVNLLELTGGSVFVASAIMLILALSFILGVLLTYMRPSIRLDVDEDLGYVDS